MTPPDPTALALHVNTEAARTYWYNQTRLRDAEAATLRAEVERLRAEFDAFYDFVNNVEPAIVDAFLFTQNNTPEAIERRRAALATPAPAPETFSAHPFTPSRSRPERCGWSPFGAEQWPICKQPADGRSHIPAPAPAAAPSGTERCVARIGTGVTCADPWWDIIHSDKALTFYHPFQPAPTPAATEDAGRCGWVDGCRYPATTELSINRKTWNLCDDHAVRVLEAFTPEPTR